MLVQTLSITEPLAITASPLTKEAFAPFGDVITNPRPESRPSNTTPEAIAAGALPFGAVSTNQGSAIQYRAIASTPPQNLYDVAPSGRVAGPRMTMFVCGARARAPVEESSEVEVRVLERHPFTSQTFIPLAVGSVARRYLVVVAPTMTTAAATEVKEGADLLLPAPEGDGLPGRGLPDVKGLRGFLASGDQAVTYAAGTWHAPMIALGPADSTIDFVVVQYANDVAVEDCQEVALQVVGQAHDGKEEEEYRIEGAASRIMVRVLEEGGDKRVDDVRL
ncbi:putative ureidoglycolate hydrolase [Xylaria sp. CBS 124048]|nr:putative ureidoglycolate hydrolase [Xylaria sp. CBS 124048]